MTILENLRFVRKKKYRAAVHEAIFGQSRLHVPGISRAVALGLFIMCLNVYEAEARMPRDDVGVSLGCREQSDVSPYCSNPDIRLLSYEQLSIMDMWDATKREMGTDKFDNVNKMNVVNALMHATKNDLMIAVRQCKSDTECIKSAMMNSTSRMYEITGIKLGAGAVTEAEAAAFLSREKLDSEQDIEKHLKQKAELVELDETYEKEWVAAQSALDSSDLASFNSIFPTPQRWVESFSQSCDYYDNCKYHKTKQLKGMVSWRDAKVRSTLATLNRQKEAESRERKIAEATLTAQAERERQQKNMQETIESATVEARTRLASGSLLNHVFFKEFHAADTIAASVVNEFFSQYYGGFSAFVGDEVIENLRKRLVANRRALIVSAYGRTRVETLGNCGEPVERVSVRLTNDQVSKNIYGIVIRSSPGTVISYYVPVKFSPYAREAVFATEIRYFSGDLRDIMTCESDLRTVLENRMIEFADWQP